MCLLGSCQDAAPLSGCSQSSGEDRHSKSPFQAVEGATLKGRALSPRSSALSLESSQGPSARLGPPPLEAAHPPFVSSLFPLCMFFTAYYVRLPVYLFVFKVYGRCHERGILSIIFKAAYPETRKST